MKMAIVGTGCAGLSNLRLFIHHNEAVALTDAIPDGPDKSHTAFFVLIN